MVWIEPKEDVYDVIYNNNPLIAHTINCGLFTYNYNVESGLDEYADEIHELLVGINLENHNNSFGKAVTTRVYRNAGNEYKVNFSILEYLPTPSTVISKLDYYGNPL